MKKIAVFLLVAIGLGTLVLVGQNNPGIPFAPQIMSGTALPVLCNNGNIFYNVTTSLWASCGPTNNNWNMFAFGVSGSSVTSFLAPSGSWPSWLIPSVTLATTTPTLAVSAVTQGNGSKVQLAAGSTTNNHCASFDANGNIIDSGAPCNSGAGGSITVSHTYTTGGQQIAYAHNLNATDGTNPIAPNMGCTDTTLSIAVSPSPVTITSANIVTITYSGNTSNVLSCHFIF